MRGAQQAPRISGMQWATARNTQTRSPNQHALPSTRVRDAHSEAVPARLLVGTPAGWAHALLLSMCTGE